MYFLEFDFSSVMAMRIFYFMSLAWAGSRTRCHGKSRQNPSANIFFPSATNFCAA